MVRGGDDGDEDHARVAEAEADVEELPSPSFAGLALFERAPEDAGVVGHGAADHEGVAEMHRRHGRQRVDVVPRHEDRGGVVVPHGVEEAVFGR